MNISRVVAFLEFCVASVLTYFSMVAAWSVLGPHTDPRYRLDAWPLLGLYVVLPLAAAFWLCAAALFWRWKYRWGIHTLPGAILLADWWWLGYAV